LTRLADFLNRRVPEGWTPERLDAAIRVAVYDLYTPRGPGIRDLISLRAIAERVGVPIYIVESAIDLHGCLRSCKFRSHRLARIGSVGRTLIVEDASRVAE
jgi:hypothetical protein